MVIIRVHELQTMYSSMSMLALFPMFDPHVRKHSFVEFGHEIFFTAILSCPLNQERQLSVTGERMCTKCG